MRHLAKIIIDVLTKYIIKNYTIFMNKYLLKFLVFLLLFIVICIIAGIYGFLHDQISYTVSPEYFTHLKFKQFGISESLHNRIGAGIVGIMATWWMGLIIGVIIIPIGLIIPNWKNYLYTMLRSFIFISSTALLIGIFALLYGLINYRIDNLPYWSSYIPHDVENKIKFCIIGNMHNFSYIGGIVGMVVGLIYIIIKKRKMNKILKTPNVA